MVTKCEFSQFLNQTLLPNKSDSNCRLKLCDQPRLGSHYQIHRLTQDLKSVLIWETIAPSLHKTSRPNSRMSLGRFCYSQPHTNVTGMNTAFQDRWQYNVQSKIFERSTKIFAHLPRRRPLCMRCNMNTVNLVTSQIFSLSFSLSSSWWSSFRFGSTLKLYTVAAF